MQVLVFLILLSIAGTPISCQKTPHAIPGKIPQGYTLTVSPEVYGTNEKPGKSGTIYNYINGGGIVYLNHGFREVKHIVLKNNKNDSITLDIYNMGTQKNATAAFADKAICPKGFVIKDIGTPLKTYRYEPDILLYFVKGKYLVFLTLNNDAAEKLLMQFAVDIYRNLE
ncbi:MAG: hypothetical protein GY757_17325 [bacterium]|nr:hypothetical protein [bacterium]